MIDNKLIKNKPRIIFLKADISSMHHLFKLLLFLYTYLLLLLLVFISL